MKKITHSGEVRRVAPGHVQVAIVASGACHTCRARELCGMSESREKLIDVCTSEAEQYRVGERVVVSEEQAMAVRAVLIAYVGAFAMLVVSLVGALALGLSEGGAAWISLMAVGGYYGVVYLLRNRIERKIYFTIRKE